MEFRMKKGRGKRIGRSVFRLNFFIKAIFRGPHIFIKFCF